MQPMRAMVIWDSLPRTEPGCASFHCDPIIQSNLPLGSARTGAADPNCPGALSGPKLARFQGSGDARINNVGLVEGLLSGGGRQNERKIFRSSDGGAEKWPLDFNASNDDACGRRGGVDENELTQLLFLSHSVIDIGEKSVSAPSSTYSCFLPLICDV
jgi:hypothetical protein